MKPNLIEVKDAQLKILSVEVKALVVSGKQMTLAVFRQLPTKEIWKNRLKNELGLLGKPWGIVRYQWGSETTNIHLVWQEGSLLFRQALYECSSASEVDAHYPGGSIMSKEDGDILWYTEHFSDQSIGVDDVHGFVLEKKTFVVTSPLSNLHVPVALHFSRFLKREEMEEAVELPLYHRRKRFLDEAITLDLKPDGQKLFKKESARVFAKQELESARIKKFTASLNGLVELGQLFIAV